MGLHHIEHAPQESVHLLAPARGIGRLERHGLGEAVEHRHAQFVATGDVDVQRRRTGVELRRHPAHGDGVEPLSTEE